MSRAATCRDCGSEFFVDSIRGKLPAKCPDCREGDQTAIPDPAETTIPRGKGGGKGKGNTTPSKVSAGEVAHALGGVERTLAKIVGSDWQVRDRELSEDGNDLVMLINRVPALIVIVVSITPLMAVWRIIDRIETIMSNRQRFHRKVKMLEPEENVATPDSTP